MDNIKDTKRTLINYYGQQSVSNSISLENKSIYEFANKKTEKILTAVYLVSDCMDTDDSLRTKIRSLAVSLLSDIHTLYSLQEVEKESGISKAITRIGEIVSFLGVAHNIGFISEMNMNILKKEFGILEEDLMAHLSKGKMLSYSLSPELFDMEGVKSLSTIKDKKLIQNTVSDRVSFINKMAQTDTSDNSNSNRHSTHAIIMKDKKERGDKILNFIKDTSSKTGKKEFSVKDITQEFTDRSEKTIQRELNLLVDKGHLSKTGEKRWSKYKLVSSD